jgi:hypothetical protein
MKVATVFAIKGDKKVHRSWQRGRVVCRLDGGPVPAPHRLVEYNRAALKRALPAVKKFAELEGLDAHGKSAEIGK